MRNPFRSEAQAFRFLLLVAAAAGALAVSSAAAGTAVTIAVGIVAAAAVAAGYLLGRPQTRRLPSAPAHVGPPTERRALLLVDELPRPESLSAVGQHADRVLVVSPAGTSSLRRWLSDVDGPRERARERMEEVVSGLRAAHVDASGVVGDPDPLAALDDALRTFGGDEIVASTGDPKLIARLRDRYAIPVSPALDDHPAGP